jgi:hypothetical protein
MTMRNAVPVLLVPMLAILVWLGSPPASANVSASAGIPPVTDAELDQALALAGANRPELDSALAHFAGDAFATDALRFTIVSLPLADLSAMSSDLLIEHVALAMKVRDEMPFAAEYDAATWAHYVLAPRVSQEPIEPWRSYFYGQLAEQVRGCSTLREAIVAVKQWVGPQIKFKQTQRRDQGPLTTLKGVYGRCEELMTVEICAMRAVGIPARNAFCPWWAHCDNNHAWTEVLCDGVWQPSGTVELDPAAGHTWEMDACLGAPIVCTMCFGLPAELGADVISHEDEIGARYAQLNNIGSYRRTGRLHLDLLPAIRETSDPYRSYKADDSIDYYVYVHVFNYGALRPVAKLTLDDASQVEVELGAGRYVLSTDAPVANRSVWVDLPAGVDLQVDWAQAEPVGDELVLEFPKDNRS